MSLVSIVIPSRQERFLQKTILDLLDKAQGDIEVIAVLDGYWPQVQEIVNDPRVHYLHRGQALGMRAGINAGVAVAKGEYIMKLDGHCMVDEGFDIKLAADCEDNWIVIPRRKRLDAENWCLQDVGKPDIDYEYLSYPDNPNDWGGPGLNGREWKERALERKHIELDENMSFQGSGWFMKKSYFYELELMDEENYGPFWNEAQELGLKCWLSGGKVMTNKKTWYAHLHKGKKYGRGYFLKKEALNQGAAYTRKWFMEDKVWHKQIYPLSWLIERFSPVPGWPETGEKPQLSPLEYIALKYGVDLDTKSPIQLPITRDELASLFAELGYKTGAEIGVERGHYSKVLCGNNPGLLLQCVDPWEAYQGYREHVSQDKLDGFYAETQERLAEYNVNLIRKYSLDAVKEFADSSLDFVYIDGNHDFQNTTNDIAEWSKRVRKGGIIAGHDYNRNKKKDYKCHVKDVVQGWTYAHDIRPWFITSDKSPSWFYIKA